MSAFQAESSKKVYGFWRGKRAFMWDGFIFLCIGNFGSWVKIGGSSSDFEPYGPEHLNDPKYRNDLKRVGGEYVSAHGYQK